MSELTTKQLIIIQLLANGMCPKTVAKTLCLSLDTVKSHLKRARRLTGSANTTNLIARCLRAGLIS